MSDSQWSRTEEELAKLAGEDLDDDEADEIFGMAWDDPETDVSEEESVVALEKRREESAERSRTALWVSAAVVLLAGGVGAWLGSGLLGAAGEPGITADRGIEGIKRGGGGAFRVDLTPYALPAGRDDVDRELQEGERVPEGERIVLRYRLVRRTHALLVALPNAEEPEVLWRSEATVRPGERELAEDGRALGLDPTRYEGTFELLLVAGPEDQLRRVATSPTGNRTELAEICPRCGFDRVELRAP